LAGLRALLRTDLLAAGTPTPHAVAKAQLFAQIDALESHRAPGLDTTSDGAVRRHRWVGSSRVFPWVAVAAGVTVAASVVMRSVRDTNSPQWTNGPRYATQSGQRATVRLSDGTQVRLGPATTLSLSGQFGQRTRSVRLSGQALFVVTETGHIPFVVHTNAVTTRVLGTTFTLRHYPTDTAVQIIVESGRVATNGRGAPVTLSAGDVAHVTDSTIALATGRGPGQFMDWEHDLLVFRGTPVPELLTTVGRWYGYEFRLADSSLSVGRVSV
jgi:ferric-dicitrate binding protein FerR (iron transport regulator)